MSHGEPVLSVLSAGTLKGGKLKWYEFDPERGDKMTVVVLHTDPEMVNSLVTDLPAALPLAARFYSGASELPTRFRIRYGNRWHRVYATAYSNASSAFIRKGGENLYLDIDTEYALSDGLASEKLGV